jgi:galactose mutarotase-like enzyme
MTTPPADWITLESSALSAAIDPQGAQLSVLRDAAGHDLLWNGDPAFWGGRAPVLFPIVGTLQGGQYRWRGQRYTLSRHGFARGRRFEAMKEGPGTALLQLADDPDTRAVYPFPFILEMAFALDGATLTVLAHLRNPGDVPLPASLGFHPAFRWPLPQGLQREAHVIEFEDVESARIRRLDANGLLNPLPQPSPVAGRRLALRDALFADDVVIFDVLRSRALTYGATHGPRLRMEFPDATHLGLWTRPGAPFICIEPWRGVSDPAGFDGEFDTKPGVFLVPPGEAATLTMRITLLPG